MEFRVLGPLEVRLAGHVVEVAGSGQRALLARLLLDVNRVVSAEQLLVDLWVTAPSSGIRALHQRMAQLRQALDRGGAGKDVIQTSGAGYLMEFGPEQLDLHQFEGHVADGEAALSRDKPQDAATAFLRALELWRGPPLAEFGDAPFATPAGARLEELRLVVLEKRFDAELALGRHLEAIGELEDLATRHPFREGFRAKLMLALYRAGRQAEALEVYQRTRRGLVEELGVEPTAALQELERAILQQDPSLSPQSDSPDTPRSTGWQPSSPERSILIVPDDTVNLERLIAIGEPLTRRPPRELVLTAVAPTSAELAETGALLADARAALLARRVPARAAAFTSESRGEDIVRFASAQDVDLLLTDAPAALLAGGVPPADLEAIFREAPCDVAVIIAEDGRGASDHDGEVMVPFGGTEHDWAALEMGSWFAASKGASLTLLGADARPDTARRDASRMLAAVSLIVQRSTGVAAKPELIAQGEEAVLDASENAALLVVGLSERWADEGLGPVRLALAREARPPTLIVRSGIRPGGIAPQDGLTRYTWSLAQKR